MNYSWIGIIGVGLLLSFFGRQSIEKLRLFLVKLYGALLPFFRRSWRVAGRVRRDENLARLEEVVRSAELTNSSFFRSLELVHKNLEFLLLRAETAEQRLLTLVTQAEAGRTDPYAAAAHLLSNGKEVEQVASMLKISPAQVRLIQELRQVAGRQRVAAPRAKREKEFQSNQGSQKAKAETLREKDAARQDIFKTVGIKGSNGAGPREKNAVP